MKLETYLAAPAQIHAESLRLLKEIEGYDPGSMIACHTALQIAAAIYLALSKPKPSTSETHHHCVTDEFGNKQYSVILGDSLNVKEGLG